MISIRYDWHSRNYLIVSRTDKATHRKFEIKFVQLLGRITQLQDRGKKPSSRADKLSKCATERNQILTKRN